MRRIGVGALALLLLGWMAAVGPAPAAEAAGAGVVAVIVHPQTATGKVDADALAQIYKRRRLYWRDGARIQPVNLPADHPLRRRFSQAVLHQLPEAMDEYWNEQYFHGALPPHVLASAAGVLRFVGATAGAIGYVDPCTLDDSVRLLMIIGADGRVLAADAERRAPCAEPAR
ncbi:hypothetical protein AAG565_03550 [Fontimonas sp. SYSU GA230001]|uniref:hypothetical protein n=1 Tax=Fontimonas sp. SYSU GA230001 TaxID=3142450 RepID=UPI0032B496F4